MCTLAVFRSPTQVTEVVKGGPGLAFVAYPDLVSIVLASKWDFL